ncbi:PhzF family phenazine biosynthesis protein [Vacuolonema iberomarrocanum]|uniref:PhzF family phenazine biosynthesis protein n=1 Tax=Vacuolonema iberomarrocanum TaxID=3454632 RepID=UPI001A00B47D|nr:PhzF family phenazine biosynthesis protein [filamentous cyanobacterium LEGE 07170]
MGQKVIWVDAFTTEPFSGNPAAVCVLSEPMDAQQMQQLAAEINLSETAFLLKQADGYSLRWFTPAVEVALCGHATLASAHVLWAEGHVPPGQAARFHTRSGVLTAQRQGDRILLNFPSTPASPVTRPEGLLEALGSEVQAKCQAICKNQFDYLIEVASETLVRKMKPDFTRLRSLPVRGIIVTSRSEGERYDFISRFFAPGSGVDEDPVTGSAHCALAPFWGDRLQKNELWAYQASTRGGELYLQWQGDRVILSGQAVTVMRAELMI